MGNVKIDDRIKAAGYSVPLHSLVNAASIKYMLPSWKLLVSEDLFGCLQFFSPNSSKFIEGRRISQPDELSKFHHK